MPIAAVPATSNRAAPVEPTVVLTHPAPMLVPDAFAKDAILAWFRGEFAAANAIIDALCGHLAQLDRGSAGGGRSEYESLFAEIHRRRMNWIPVLQMQKYHSIAGVAMELRKVAENKGSNIGNDKTVMLKEVCLDKEKKEKEKVEVGTIAASLGNGTIADHDGGEVVEEEDSPDSDITDSGSQEAQPPDETIDICSNHEDCIMRPDQIKLTKGFNAKEQVKRNMVNVVKGLKLYEDVFTHSELSKLADFVNELRVAGQNGELEGETFVLFNKQMKGNKRELIQLGIPIFGHIKEEAAGDNKTTGNIEPIPALLQGVIDHLIQWQLIPEYKRPNGCIIHLFDEDEYSQPFQKPPHLEQPISTLLLSESTMAFGRTLVIGSDGNYKGPLILSLKEGSLLVMRGNSSDVARHVMCPSPNKRVSITFFKVRPDAYQCQSPPTSPMAAVMTLWQPGIPSPYRMPDGTVTGHEAMDSMPQSGGLRTPVLMLAPMHPMVLSPERMPPGGTGVFLPWTIGSRKPTKHLPPRAQKRCLLDLPPSVETHTTSSTSETGFIIEGNGHDVTLRHS